MIQDNYKGFALFSDVMDKEVRIRNRATVLANISQDNMRENKLSPKGVSLVLGYFSSIPEDERLAVRAAFVESMNSRGFELA